MEIEYKNDKIKLEKELNLLDKLVINFTSKLNKFGLGYVIVSGYVSILFGRSRSSEDIDLIIEKITNNQFQNLWHELSKDFECITTSNPQEALKEYLLANHAIRFSIKNNFIPNIEIKFPKNELDLWTLKERKEVILNKNKLFISPLELQIPFKLFLGSEKDVEDAKYLYKIFKDKIDLKIMQEFNRKLKIEHLFNRYIK